MRRFALALCLVAGSASAELVLKTNGMVMRLQSSPCADRAVLQHIDAKFHPRFKFADVAIDGKQHSGCWVDEGETVWLIFADGSGGQMSKALFKDDPGI